MNLRIRDLREDNDLYQRHIAEYLGCKQQTYSRYETGELEPSLPVMAKLAAFYKTSVDFLMGLTDVRDPYEPAANKQEIGNIFANSKNKGRGKSRKPKEQ